MQYRDRIDDSQLATRTYTNALKGSFVVAVDAPNFLLSDESWEGRISTRVRFVPLELLYGAEREAVVKDTLYLLSRAYVPPTSDSDLADDVDAYKVWTHKMSDLLSTDHETPALAYRELEIAVSQELLSNGTSSVRAFTALLNRSPDDSLGHYTETLVPVFEDEHYVVLFNGDFESIDKGFTPSRLDIYPFRIFEKYLLPRKALNVE